MTLFRVEATAESLYIQNVEADDATSAVHELAEQIRAGAITPVVGPGVRTVNISLARGASDPVPPRADHH